MPCVKETIILTLVTTTRQTLCRIIVMSIGTTSVGLCSKGDVGFNFKYSKERREGIYSQRVGWGSGGTMDGKLLKGNVRDKKILAKSSQEDSCYR